MEKRFFQNSALLRQSFVKTYWSVASRMPHSSVSARYSAAILTPAPEWFISTRTAMREMRMIRLAGRDDYYNASEVRRKLFLDLHAAVTAFMNENPDVELRKALDTILTLPAPQYYISVRTARYFVNITHRKSIKR